ncbi:MAG: sugar ABC transporter permease [Exiguobacterium sp.]|uniref:carbohydrate ABC transporter permease n=1 Tax=Exiguobacterium sp. AB2 TaxID=1484479 RepID=UPI0004A97AE7|nr:sugar ABC transporter permease [Exiguobacterium sp. AB2]KDN58141.1 sugar ABC transporter permease [Exiguobacterium sp. AB2]MDX5323814.1 sugar ABC transporter permease [Exiguobacterium sp.]MDX5425629.1 sugar ABC transporter permease [Exiguobacterium sp.]MDX6773032.1 sugar ABC transporter permease [Exiguobacterium sp.]
MGTQLEINRRTDAVAQAPSPKNGKGSERNRREALQGVTFMLPTLILLFTFTLLPIFYSLFLSFTRVNLFGGIDFQWVGFTNYVNAWNDDRVWAALNNTFRYALFVVPIQTAVALLMAAVLNSGIRFQNTFRTIYFLPTLTSSSALTMIFMFLFSLNGPINNLLVNFGLLEAPVNFINETDFALATIMVMNIWSTVPFFMTIYLAGLQDIPHSLYEAASLDGANAWQKLMKITVPNLTPVTNYVLLMGIIGCFQLFDQAYIISGGTGGPNNATLTFSLIIYQYAFQTIGTMGYASALAIILTLIIFTVSMIARRLNKEESNY